MALDIGFALPMLTDVGLAACLAIAYGHCSRLVQKRHTRAILIGGIFGLASTLSSIYHPLSSANPLQSSAAVFIGFASAFLGPIGALPAVIVAAGSGLMLHVVGAWEVSQFLVAGIAGMVWSTIARDLDRRSTKALIALGAWISAAMLPGYIWQHSHLGTHSNIAMAGSFVASLIVTVLVGTFMERERAMLEAELQMHHLANTDPLTGLYNRRTITAAFENRSLTRAGHALMLIDIDHFKSVNDAHGHAAGDEVLRHIAHHLQASVRTGDVLSRFGGEEFAVLLAADSPEEALAAGERLRSDVEHNRVRIGQLALQVTVSVGIAWWTGQAHFADKLNQADLGLYRAKTEGRNRVHFASLHEQPQTS